MLLTYIRKVFCSNRGRGNDYLDRGFPWFFSDCPGKYRYNILNFTTTALLKILSKFIIRYHQIIACNVLIASPSNSHHRDLRHIAQISQTTDRRHAYTERFFLIPLKCIFFLWINLCSLVIGKWPCFFSAQLSVRSLDLGTKIESAQSPVVSSASSTPLQHATPLPPISA
jgi:hypothetical protein